MSDFDDALHRELRALAAAGRRQAQGLPGEQVRRVTRCAAADAALLAPR